MKKVTLLLFGLFLIFSEAQATHLLGGEIMWECHPTTGKYRFTTRLYRECGGFSAQLPQTVSLSGGPVNISCPQIMLVDVSRDCGSPISGVSCTSNSPKNVGAVEMGVYRSAWVTLNGIPPKWGWMFTWGSCCRTTGIINIVSSTFLQRATMYPYKNSNVSSCLDNSPEFLETPLFAACSGEDVTFNNAGFDVDGDSLFYEFAPFLTTSGSYGTYDSSYSFSSPFPSNLPPFNSNNKSIKLNCETGQLNFTTYDNGGYLEVIKMEEWRCGVLIGEVFREYPTFIYACVPDSGSCMNAVNHKPTLNLVVDSIAHPNGPWVVPVLDNLGELIQYETTVYAKDNIHFSIHSIDSDSLSNCTKQLITFNASGGNLSSDSLWSDSSICEYSAPCATINSLNVGGAFTSTDSNVVDFNWSIDCPHLTYRQFANSCYKSSYMFYFNMTDNACPIMGENHVSYNVKVLSPQPTAPVLQSCVDLVASSGDLSFNWTAPTDTNINFDYYVVYHSQNKTGPYTALDTLTNYTDTNFTDFGRGSGTNHYFVRTAGGCSMLSETSDTISLMHLIVAPNPATNPTQSVLSWTAYSTNTTGVYYQIWKNISPSLNWVLIDSTQALTYTDNLNGNAFSNINYQIGIHGGCLSSLVYVGIEEELLNSVEVSPNPFNDNIIVKIPTEINANAVTLKLFEVGGKELKSIEFTIRDSEIEIRNVKRLPRGTYVLQLSAMNKTKTIKLVH